MTRKSRREIEREIADLKTDDVDDIQVSSTVVTITEDMTDEYGNHTAESDPPAESTVLPTESPVVTVHELEPVDDDTPE